MILKRIIIAIYMKSVFPPYDSNIKFYNAIATVLKMLKSKLHFIKNGLSKKDAPEYVYMFRIFFNLQQQIWHKKFNNTAYFDINWIITNF